MKTLLRPFLLMVPALAVACGLLAAGLLRLDIDTDVINAMPTADPVIRESAAIFRVHPIQDQVWIDLSLPKPDPEQLVRWAAEAETQLEASGLFSQVGGSDWQDSLPELVFRLAGNLPELFTADQLHEKVAPRLMPEAMARRMGETVRSLQSLSGIGRAALIAEDPLGLSEIAVARLAQLAPSGGARIYKGRVISKDGAHLLLPAKPRRSSTDTDFARKIAAAVDEVSIDLDEKAASGADRVTVTPIGAFRSALDNERLIRADVESALLFSAVGIALLLLLAFSRPLLGLAALLPAAAGTMAALFVYSLFNDAIAAMVLGFGGAVVSITVDHGIAYLLFIDGKNPQDGRSASEEVRAVGLLAALTSIGAFSALMLTGFPAFRQLGLFAALGIGISFLFVHTVFPAVFRNVPPARSQRRILQQAADALARLGTAGAAAAVVLAVGLAFFARPGFDVRLTAMNTVSDETRKAEAQFSHVWGGIFDRIFLMTEAEDMPALREKMDALYLRMQPDLAGGVLKSGFVASAVFPGPMLAAQNRAAWHSFWTPEKIARVRARLSGLSAVYGFAPDAFEPFYRQLAGSGGDEGGQPLPAVFYDLAGVFQARDSGKWMQVSTLTTGPAYDGEQFRERYRQFGKIFDPSLFSERLGHLLFDSFSTLLLVIGVSVAALLLFFFLDGLLTAVALLPVGFALICTLGTLTLMGRAIDIPGLMLSIVVMGMGIDYSLFFVRSFQRYGSFDHPQFSRIRLAVLMAGASTLIGFGVLCFSDHTLLKSAGITSFLGIGYALLGAFLILPPALVAVKRRRSRPLPATASIPARVRFRYRNLEVYPRLFARFKQHFDPMFAELPELLADCPEIETILDVGTGYGVPGAWLLERCRKARLWGIEPDRIRVRVSSMALADRAVVTTGAAPALPAPPAPIDLAFALDMIHYLDDLELKKTLTSIHRKLAPDGVLLIRAAVPPKRRWAVLWHLERIRLKLRGIESRERSRTEISEMIEACGFRIERTRSSGAEPGELIWWKAAPTADGSCREES
jgi:predicted exporter/SAM-dependent methyltransferase